ncbi:GILT-like protein 1 [Manduca sexta]|uniref:GILT-like protein 1 n=1 Tax=Manduca sexta TaxID=7130 RepID=UPI00188FB6B5|nr:GILT-like protein 1 [Manduca sexta]
MAHFFVYIACFVFALNSATADQDKIKITIGTTAGCSNTAKFINEQLVHTYKQYKDNLEIEFVPWGRTVRDVTGALSCQYGKKDCWANRLQRCVLNLLKDTTAQLNYMQCEFSRPFPSYVQNNYRCARTAGVYKPALQCMNRGFAELDRAAEEKARLPMQLINYVPSISINDIHDSGVHNAAIAGLSEFIKKELNAQILPKPTTIAY